MEFNIVDLYLDTETGELFIHIPASGQTFRAFGEEVENLPAKRKYLGQIKLDVGQWLPEANREEEKVGCKGDINQAKELMLSQHFTSSKEDRQLAFRIIRDLKLEYHEYDDGSITIFPRFCCEKHNLEDAEAIDLYFKNEDP